MNTTPKPQRTAGSARQAERQQRAKELHAKLAQKVDELVDSAQWKTFLDFCAAFHRYSVNNVLLILAQHPTATQVAGYKRWQALGRQVRDGEKAIRIFGYGTRTITELDPETDTETARKVPSFPILSVFAFDQTDPIPGVVQADQIAHRLTGPDPANIYDRATAALAERGWSVERELLSGERNGYTSLSGDRRVVVDERLCPAQAAKTLLHEFGHVVLHAEPALASGGSTSQIARHPRGVEETEAESVAYIVAGLLGLDTADYSVGYIAEWADGDTKVIAATAARVHAAVVEIAAGLDGDAHVHSEAQPPVSRRELLAS